MFSQVQCPSYTLALPPALRILLLTYRNEHQKHIPTNQESNNGMVECTDSQVLSIAALALAAYVGASPIFFSGVNNPLVILLNTLAEGSNDDPLLLPTADPDLFEPGLEAVACRLL